MRLLSCSSRLPDSLLPPFCYLCSLKEAPAGRKDFCFSYVRPPLLPPLGAIVARSARFPWKSVPKMPHTGLLSRGIFFLHRGGSFWPLRWRASALALVGVSGRDYPPPQRHQFYAEKSDQRFYLRVIFSFWTLAAGTALPQPVYPCLAARGHPL